MMIRVKLMGMLKDRSPAGGKLELADGASVQDVLAALEVDPKTVQAWSINGSIDRNLESKLADNDELTVLPPVGGG